MIEIRLLGEIEVLRDGRKVALGGRRQQALLTHLVLAAGRSVPTERLADELWSGEPPDGATGTIRSYVSRLRTILGDDMPIVGRSGGYAIDPTVGDVDVDVRTFERLVGEAPGARTRGEIRVAHARLREALALWRGPALAGVADDGDLRIAAERLEEMRLAANEDAIEAGLQLGEAAGLVTELERLVADHPYRERPWRQLMLALYRSGRTADALAAYHRATVRLRDDLGLEPGSELQELEGAILRQEVPRPAADTASDSVPIAMTAFIGRADELAAIERHLEMSRLVTLTGIGGVGKTRLAIETARRTAERWSDGPWFVDLSALTEPALVAREVAGVIGVAEQSDETAADRLAAHLGTTRALLILDNCEHLRAAAASLVRRLLGAAPGLHVLATSREPLGVSGEVDIGVAPLPTPAAHDDPTTFEASDAVQLFLARARDARPGIGTDREVVRAAAAICRDLDGLPLAIELAAARVKAFSVPQIAERIDDRFRFLVSWRRLAPDRHRTLKEAMDWSHELLEPAEQALLRDLSVFAGGFTLEAVAAICVGGDEAAAVDLLAHLVDASLVPAEERGAAMRYRLLETVRQYAAGRLAEMGDDGPLRDRHAQWFLALAEATEPHLTGARQSEAFATLETEHDNLRAALGHLETTGDAGRLLRLATALSRFWYVRGYLSESRRWLESGLESSGETSPLLRRRALTAAGAVALLQGQYGAAVELSERSLEAARETADQRLIANGLSNLGAITLAAGDRVRARGLIEEAVALARSLDDTRIAGLAINNLGDLALTEGDYERARPLFEESLALLRQRGDVANIARSLFNLGAVELMLEAPRGAAVRFRESVELGRRTGDKEDLAWCLLGIAGVTVRRGDGALAARLLGAGSALLEAMGAAFKPFERHLHDDTLARARDLAGSEVTERERARGTTLTLEIAIDQALTAVSGEVDAAD